jgi:hypothetical protein
MSRDSSRLCPTAISNTEMPDPTPTCRFRPTPAWLIFGLLVVEGLLWLSARYRWFWFDGGAAGFGAAGSGRAGPRRAATILDTRRLAIKLGEVELPTALTGPSTSWAVARAARNGGETLADAGTSAMPLPEAHHGASFFSAGYSIPWRPAQFLAERYLRLNRASRSKCHGWPSRRGA